jgi:hypothetical protein
MTLYDVRDRPAIDLEMESQIPSEVRHSFHNQATGRGPPLRNCADGKCTQKSENQKKLADETMSRFHGIYYARDWFFASAVKPRVAGWVLDCVRLGVVQATEWQRIAD